MNIRPQDLPEIRADLAEWINGPDAATFWRKALETGYLNWLFTGDRPMGPEDAAVLRGTEINRLRSAELFHVSAEMVDVARAAARTIPDFQLAREDLPTMAGLMVFDKSPCPAPPLGETPVGVKAVCWAPIPNGRNNTLFGTVYLDREEAAPAIAKATLYRKPYSEPKLTYAHGGEFVWAFGENKGRSPDPSSFLATLAPVLRSTWLLMQQPLTREERADPSRASSKRLRRAGHEPAPVRVIELRRPKNTGGHGDGDREYHHQWIVRGHWRQQWHPKRQVHRPVWIAPHIKGPEGAPLIGGEKVYALKR